MNSPRSIDAAPPAPDTDRSMSPGPDGRSFTGTSTTTSRSSSAPARSMARKDATVSSAAPGPVSASMRRASTAGPISPASCSVFNSFTSASDASSRSLMIVSTARRQQQGRGRQQSGQQQGR